MINTLKAVCACTAILFFSSLATAQATPSKQSPIVPQLVNFSGKALDDQGKPLAGIVGITFAIYNAQDGGAPLWIETQSVQPDTKGNYTVQLGAATSEGLPLSLFSSGEARWLGVRVNSGEEQPRILLLSVPYALKAADAQTLNGLPASAFVLAAPSASNPQPPASSNASSAANIGGSGSEDYIPLWTDNNGDLGNSILYQLGTGSTAKIGINETKPLFTLDVNGQELVRGLFEMATQNYASKTKGYDSQPLNFESSAFSSSAGTYTLEHFQWQSEPTGNDTNNPSATLNLLFGEGTNNPSETGLNIAANGQITFVKGQTYPGAGTITGVTAGTDLTGGGTNGNVTLNLNTANIPQLSSINAFSALNTFPKVGVGTSSPLANLDVVGSGLNILLGDPGCGTFAAIGFQNQALSGCTNYALLGDASGGTYVNASGTSQTIHFRVNNNDEVMDIQPNTVVVSGQVGIGTSSPAAILDVETPGSEIAGYFENDDDNGYAPATLTAFNSAAGDDNAYVLSVYGTIGGCDIDYTGGLYCTGSKSAVVPVDGGSRKVALYAVESPENWFEDYGSGQLSKGSARIDLEPTFAQTVNTEMDYKVFPVPNGDCNGLYVTHKTATSFEVRELHGGASNVTFDYRIIAKRKKYETVRLADLTERYKKLAEQRARMHQHRPAAIPAASNSAAASRLKPGIAPAK